MRSLPGVLCWETTDEMPGFSSPCTMNNSQEWALSSHLNYSIVLCSKLVFPHLIRSSSLTPAVHSHHFFLLHFQHLLSIYPNFQIPRTAPAAHPTFPALSPKQPSKLNPSCVSVKNLCEPNAQNSLLFPLWSHSVCTAFISSDLVLHLPPNCM